MMSRLGLVAVLLGGCGGRAAPVSEPPAPMNETSEPAAAAMSYAALVEPGARWTFRIHEDQSANGVEPADVEYPPDAPTATCEVSQTVELANGRAAWITCEGFPDESRNPLAGNWAATEAGVFQFGYDMPEPGTRLDGSDPFLSARPVEHEETVENPPEDEFDEETSNTERVEQLADGAWCRVAQYAATRGSLTRLCFDAAGPVEGNWYWEDLDDFHSTFFRRVDAPAQPKQ